MRFYSGESWWSAFYSAALLRAADTTESITGRAGEMSNADVLTLLRSLYEQVVTLCWVATDPDVRHQVWVGDARRELIKLAADAAKYGADVLPTRVKATTQRLPPLPQRAEAADAYWAARVDGLHVPGHLLAFRGLYVSIYRLGSRSTHGSFSAAAEYVDQTRHPIEVRQPAGREPLWPALATPTLSMGLAVASTRLRWVDADEVRRLNDLATGAGGLSSPAL
jgi:hypothetical protein